MTRERRGRRGHERELNSEGWEGWKEKLRLEIDERKGGESGGG